MSRKIEITEAQLETLESFPDTKSWHLERQLAGKRYQLKSLSKKGLIEARCRKDGHMEYRMTKRGLASM